MTFLLSLLLNPTVLAILAGIVGFFGWGKYKERVGAKKVRDELAAADKRALEVEDEVQSDIGSMTDEQRRAELRKWARK